MVGRPERCPRPPPFFSTKTLCGPKCQMTLERPDHWICPPPKKDHVFENIPNITNCLVKDQKKLFGEGGKLSVIVIPEYFTVK